MKKLMHLSVALVAISSVHIQSSRAEEIAPQDMVNLQAAMQSFVEQSSVDGAFLKYDHKSKTATPLYMSKAHPKMMKMGNYYELCATFKDESGKTLEVNFMMAKADDHYVVFDTSYGAMEPN